ncbi:aquaporin [Streptomyces sp. KR80]|uniref:aquaporin n=1 Tax=Streptomyces sp. KR80 TaxID=3457426 RepID=UPI003FD42979
MAETTTQRTIGAPAFDTRTVGAEFLGTLLLVFFAVGSAVLGAEYVGTVGIALAFGFVLVALAYALGPISGCHLNPAVTLGVLMARRITVRTAVEYCVAQLAGAVVGAALLFLVAKQVPGLETTGAFGTNGYGYRSAVGINIFGALVTELVLTFLLVYVFLAVTRGVALFGFGGVAYGLALAVVTLIGIPLTGAAVNPARSLAPALFSGSAPMTQLWLFLVAPLVGGVLAALASAVTHPAVAVEEPGAAADIPEPGNPGGITEPGNPHDAQESAEPAGIRESRKPDDIRE